jgi:cytochrome oxidase Cu insertion factor (SCO1/SenC/PrrC family)
MRRLTPLLAVLLTGCGLTARPGVNTSPAETEIDPGWQVGPFAFTERSGKAVTDQDLRGNVWVASFVFTRCMGPCPAVTATVARLQSELKDEPGVKFVTFTVDPARDDLASLNEYAKARGADPGRWLFLTGDEATVHKVLREQFKQGTARNPHPGQQPGDEFDHSTRLVLVDKNGVIRGLYEGLADDRFPDAAERFEAGLAKLKAKARELAR